MTLVNASQHKVRDYINCSGYASGPDAFNRPVDLGALIVV